MRILRAVYNNAVDNEVIENRNPFRKVFTGAEKTIKRALNLTTIKKNQESGLITQSQD